MGDWFVDGEWRLTTRMGDSVLLLRAGAVPPAKNVQRIPLPSRVLRRDLEHALLGVDPWERAKLCEVLRSVQGHDAHWGYAPLETELRTHVLPRLVEALADGDLVAFREERLRPLPSPGLEPPDEKPEEAPTEELTWIAVQVLDTDGEPVQGARYELELTDGSVRRGRTDREGMVRVDGIPPGQCKLRLPDHENELIPGTPPPEEAPPAPEPEEAAAPDSAPETPEEIPVADETPETPKVLEAHVHDRKGNPIANRAFRAVFDDGSVREGRTDAEGLVRIEDCPPGECHLTFLAPPSS